MSRRKRFLRLRSKAFHFRMDIPLWWKRYAFIESSYDSKRKIMNYSFKLRYRKPIRGKKSTTIFDLYIFHMTKEKWLKQFQDSPYQFIAYREGKVYSYLTPLEPPEEFLRKDQSDYRRDLFEFKMLSHMINKDVPKIIKSFKITLATK